MDEEKRIIRRQRVLKSGKIIFGDGASVVDCVIRNLTVAGARLEIPTTVGIPQEFDLLDVHSSRTRRGKVAWRRGATMGVEFSDPPEEEDED